ncbi:TonB-dependent receptor [Sphingomonas sp. CROZ-RG-20F-R02-07]|uniref:TonB-dependent receptor n=1 Tax=Sphingomonas sp. CROZ-RG-20F-R02-07 TaxID=2914832 RepID=UPI001F569503|nr:TonB-dependent receptor [Sphingomonas sp. CROZ-RG-20F-R02-07]
MKRFRLALGASLTAIAASAGSAAYAQQANGGVTGSIPVQQGNGATTGSLNVQQGSGNGTGSLNADQAATAPQSDDIVVTGVRESLRSAQAIKRNSDQIVDSVNAQDIGKLPDANTIEALQRITGVQIQRRYGEGATDFDHRTSPAVTVRGLTQTQNFLDGRAVYSASGGRAFDLEGMPPELLAGIDVYKNPPANIIEGGIGGAINLRTRLPFDAPGQVVSVTAKGNYYDRADKFGGSGSALYSNRFETGMGEIGVLLNVSYAKSDYRQDAILIGPFGPVAPGSIAGAPSNPQIPYGVQLYNDEGDRRRLGVAGALQWQATDRLLLTAQALYTRYTFFRSGKYFYANNGNNPSPTDSSVNLATPLAGGSFTFAPGSYTDPATGQVMHYATKGSLQSQIFESARFDQDLTNTSGNYTLNAKWQATDHIKVNLDGQYLKSSYDADRNGFVISLYDKAGETGRTAPNQTIVDFDLTGSRPRWDVRNPAILNNPASYGFTYMADSLQRNDADQLALASDIEYDNEGSFLDKFRLGARFAHSTIDLRGSWNAFCLYATGPDATCGAPAGTPFTRLSQYPQLALNGPSPHFFDGQTATGGIVYPNFVAGNGLFDSLTKTEALFGATPQTQFKPGDLNHQTERTITGYAIADYKGSVFGLEIDGTAGVRLVQTRTTSMGTVFQNNGTTAAIDLQQTYFNALPSFDLRAHLTSKLQARFAYSKGVARPNFDQLSTNLTLSAANQINPITGHPSASSGNPFLRPIKSDNLDLTLEWYFAPAGSLTGGLFYKKVNGFLASGIINQTYNGTVYDVSTNVNSGNGTIKGLEVAYQQFFDFLPGFLKGFGVQANYTLVDSSVANPFFTPGSAAPQQSPLEKLSKNSYNLVGLYERGPLTARLAWSWRGRYLDATSGSGAPGQLQFANPYASLDASISANLNKHIAVSVDAVNLNNRMNETYIGTPLAPLQYQLNDRRFGFSIRATY